MTVALLTGGAGYIGSFTARRLLDAGYELVVVDNLSSGHPAALPQGTSLVEADLGDLDAIRSVVQKHSPAAVVHFAGSIEAGESMTDPRRFYHNNVVGGLNLLNALIEHPVTGNRPTPVVFSSSAAVYGEPDRIPIREDDATRPVNVYGETKLVFERILAAYDHAYGLRSISLRYFNACGGDDRGEMGADHRHKTHLITVALLAALQQSPVYVFGTDYPTPDGTCIRDYIHVEDLADSHVLAVDGLLRGAATTAYNVGLGSGFSVQEVLDSVERVIDGPLDRRPHPRRPGDPAELVADPSRIRKALGWTPRYTDLDDIVTTAWKWHASHPQGYGD